MSVQLRVGGKYRTRDGRVVTVVGEHGGGSYPFVGDSSLSYKHNGFWYEPDGETDNDLVEEVIDSHLDNLTPQEMTPIVPGIPLCDLPAAPPVTCYVTLRDTPDIEPLPSNTFAHVLPCGALLIRVDDDSEKQVALFAPNSWVAYVNKETN